MAITGGDSLGAALASASAARQNLNTQRQQASEARKQIQENRALSEQQRADAIKKLEEADTQKRLAQEQISKLSTQREELIKSRSGANLRKLSGSAGRTKRLRIASVEGQVGDALVVTEGQKQSIEGYQGEVKKYVEDIGTYQQELKTKEQEVSQYESDLNKYEKEQLVPYETQLGVEQGNYQAAQEYNRALYAVQKAYEKGKLAFFYAFAKKGSQERAIAKQFLDAGYSPSKGGLLDQERAKQRGETIKELKSLGAIQIKGSSIIDPSTGKPIGLNKAIEKYNKSLAPLNVISSETIASSLSNSVTVKSMNIGNIPNNIRLPNVPNTNTREIYSPILGGFVKSNQYGNFDRQTAIVRQPTMTEVQQLDYAAKAPERIPFIGDAIKNNRILQEKLNH